MAAACRLSWPPSPGGPSTPELAAAVSQAGGLGFLATGYLAAPEAAERVRKTPDLPLVATGGIATGGGIAAALCAGASAAALGTAFLDCPEAGTSQVHREALHRTGGTAFTRAFTGRTARGIRNEMLSKYSQTAPKAYPEIHHLTAPLRQAGRGGGDADLVKRTW